MRKKGTRLLGRRRCHRRCRARKWRGGNPNGENRDVGALLALLLVLELECVVEAPAEGSSFPPVIVVDTFRLLLLLRLPPIPGHWFGDVDIYAAAEAGSSSSWASKVEVPPGTAASTKGGGGVV